MTDIDARVRVRDEAAFWFARMRRPDKDQYSEAFEIWLAANDNLKAYNRISARFADAKILRKSVSVRRPIAFLGIRQPSFVLGVIALCFVISWTIIRTGPETVATRQMANSRVNYSNARNEPIQVILADGSTVMLDAQGRLEAQFTSAQRLVKLRHGRARFTVAHGIRPFRVIAENTKVTAHGTVFDVAIMRAGQIRVALFSGSIEIAAASTASGNRYVSKLTMKPGDVIDYSSNDAAITALPFIAAQQGWPDDILDFETITLGELIIKANRYPGSDIVLADPAAANLTLSGRIGIRDSERLADHSARIFGLWVDRSTPGKLILRSR